MPVLSVFYGIIVRMFKEDNEPHHKPHLHVEYAGQKMAIAFDGEVLGGELPRGKMRLLLAWMEIHQDDLIANWKLISDGEQVFRIDPLK